MDYFKDLQFVCHGELALSRNVHHQVSFDGYWGIQYSHRGRFMLRIDRQTPEYVDGACVFISHPGCEFYYGPVENGAIENKLFICFRGARVARWMDGGLLEERRTGALLPVPRSESFLALLRRIRSLLIVPPSPENHARAVMLLEEALFEIQTRPRQERRHNDRLYPDLEELSGRIAAQPGNAWSFAREARKLGVSYAHFRRLFRDFFGTPPGMFLLESRLQQAALLLTHSDAPVRAVALECGFSDEFYFSRIFKKHRLLAPKNYRAAFRNR